MKGKCKFLALTIFLIVLASILTAAPVFNIPNQLVQPDGTVIDVLFSGDEFHNWAHTEEGYTMIQDASSGYWCWAEERNGDLVSTGYSVHLTNPQILGISPNQNISDERYKEKRRYFDDSMNQRSSNTRTPSLGVVNNLVVFIRFLGESEFSRPIAYYDNMFNAEGENVDSMHQYFWDASYQQFEVYSPFFPEPDGTTIVSYESTNPRSYYQPYNAVSNPNGYSGDTQRRLREHQLLADAIEAIHDEVPVDLVIDSDNDNYVDNVCFVVKGSTGNWADLLWPHRWVLYSFNVYLHGKRVYDYNFNIENHMNYSGVSVLAHEFTHSLGAPDYYRYVNQDYNPVGMWDLMASNTTPAQSLSAHTKFKYTSWIDFIPEITYSGTYTLFPNSVSQYNHAYKIASPNSNTEHFIIEYRSTQTGLTDSALPGSGLLVYRVNTSAGNGNAQGPPDELYVYRPGGTTSGNGTIGSAFLSANVGRTEINDLSNPNAFLSNGLPGGLNISQISAIGDSMTFYINIDGADPEYYNESFNNQNFVGYDWIVNPNAPWTITDEQSYFGDYSAVSATIGHNQTSKLKLSLQIDSGFIQFWVKTSTQNNGDYLRFYINEQLMSSWSGITGWTFYAIPVNAGTYTLTWSYEKNGSGIGGEDKVWIDGIGFPEITGHILYAPENLSYNYNGNDIQLNWQAPYQTTMANPPVLEGYNLYQNGVLFNSELITDENFTVFNTSGGNLQYTVNAVYDIGESANLQPITIPLPFAIPQNLTAELEDNSVVLNWEYPYNTLSLLGFRVYRNDVNITQTPIAPDQLSYIDSNVVEGQNYIYYIRAIYTNPTGISLPSNNVELLYTGIEEMISPQYVTKLGNNYPNPFNPETVINFSLKTDTNVKISIFNVKGEIVKTLVNETLKRGNHQVVWDGKNNSGNISGSGIYFYKMQSDNYQATNKMLLIK